ncbi:MAG: hypothetical protein COX80_00635 [Candidatus Magasanikbacteria bacterium CG_4_10_14_0_2_um_filter_33_14]|uniref:Nudix hydrolase domain-containing protein n=1 Tax=Candidatus Magasanikbacteria bacterium CG_4_10_14_0_2_um_filter_33_14 TaxID=1974636 RepID=A0A2M7VC65_9BACT|nr:MAG: hypothetical protein COX80_00635 [Candidatus Magasanikbacteria bacterium CG_4_10_14_0_2_um_filter_33_14]
MNMILPPNSIIASGPVIIEDDKVLLNKEIKESGITPWFFPGGEVEDFDINLEEACKREAKEEIGIDVEIIKPLDTLLHKKSDGRVVVLVHYLANRIGEIKKGENITECEWLNIYNLPEDVAPNVREIIERYLKTL